jgi:AAA domain (dynein-related subfamily)
MELSIGIANLEKAVEHNGQVYARADLNRMGRNELRPIARALHAARKSTVSLTWLGSAANASDLRAFILEDKADSEFGFASNGNGHIEPSSNGNGSQAEDALATLASALNGFIRPERDETVNREAVEAIVDERLANHAKVTRVEVKLPNGKVRKVDGQHKLFPKLLRLLALRENVWIVGPAGSGKSTAAHAAADALGIAYGAISVCSQTPVSALLGYMDANGQYVETEFYRRYKDGGVFNIDEIDKGNANVIAVLNSALSNGECAFPCGMVKRHEDNCIVATANTFGTGADRVYVGSLQIDGATLDRFAFLEWPYDEAFEREIVGNDEWLGRVLRYRRNVEGHNLRVVISPRASIKGARMLAAGFEQDEVETMLIFKGCDAATIAKIKGEGLN